MCIAESELLKPNNAGFPNYKSVQITDKECIQKIIERNQPLSCEYSFANIYCWAEPYDNTWSVYEDRLMVYDGVNKCSFFPLGKEMTPKELVRFSSEMRKIGMGPDIGVVSSEYIKKYPELNEFYEVVEERDSAEYIYSVKALCELKGTKLHKKKNLISQFVRKNPDFRAVPMSEKNMEKVKLLADQIYNSHERLLPGIENEHIALMTALNEFDQIGLQGLVIELEEDLIAFSIFAPLNHDTYDIHFEKSCHQFKGAAQVINHETVQYLKDRCTYINREQDLGIKGLRQAKMSYDPEKLLMSYTLLFKRWDSKNFF